ncbi:SEC-C metal-binding domain-containing protein [Sphingomonas sp. F9_3S_D5_B_2]
MKRGLRFVRGGEKELVEKLGRNDPCPCGSGKRLQALLHELGPISTAPSGGSIGATRHDSAAVLHILNIEYKASTPARLSWESLCHRCRRSSQDQSVIPS